MKTREDYLEKIEKLLRLAESPVEAEAQAALLKARELMAKHKIEMNELDVSDSKSQEVVWEYTTIYYGGRKDPWIGDVAGVIAKNMACRVVRAHQGYRSQSYGVTFVGFKEDVAICRKAFEYAVSFIQYHITEEIAKPMMKEMHVDYRTKYINQHANSYGKGFAAGLEDKFKDQWKNEEGSDSSDDTATTYEVALVVPKEVNEEVDGRTIKAYTSYVSDRFVYSSSYNKGREEGYQFDVGRKFVEA